MYEEELEEGLLTCEIIECDEPCCAQGVKESKNPIPEEYEGTWREIEIEDFAYYHSVCAYHCTSVNHRHCGHFECALRKIKGEDYCNFHFY